jgi:hypothetical protein
LRTSTNILRYWNGTYLYRKGIEAEWNSEKRWRSVKTVLNTIISETVSV